MSANKLVVVVCSSDFTCISSSVKMVVLRPDDVDLTNIFHKIITASAFEKGTSESTLTRDTLKTILSTVDTEWDKKVVKSLLTYNRSYKQQQQQQQVYLHS